MNLENVIMGKDIYKNYGRFKLNLPKFNVPKGVATALIGENGAGKTTLLDILAGVYHADRGEIAYFNNKEFIDEDSVRSRIGYTGPNNFFMPQWTVEQIKEMGSLLFDTFDAKKFDDFCNEVQLQATKQTQVKSLSDGNRMKVILATALARETKLLIMDEPASPLDPLMRDKLCEIIVDYLAQNEGENSVLFSTHNIADMEKITDYAIIMHTGKIVEQGFVEDLKEKYTVIKGDEIDEVLAQHIIGLSRNRYGFEGIVFTSRLDKFSDCNIVTETPSLSQITVAIMKHYSKLKTKK